MKPTFNSSCPIEYPHLDKAFSLDQALAWWNKWKDGFEKREYQNRTLNFRSARAEDSKEGLIFFRLLGFDFNFYKPTPESEK